MATQEGRISALESWQRSHEESEREWKMQHQEANRESVENLSANFALRLETVEQVANEAVTMARQTNIDMATMPQKIVEAIETKGKGKRFEAKEWMTLAIAILLLILAIPTSLQAYQNISRPQSSVQASK